MAETKKFDMESDVQVLLNADAAWRKAKLRNKLMRHGWSWLETHRPVPEHTKQVLKIIQQTSSAGDDELDGPFGESFSAYVGAMDRLYSGEDMSTTDWVLLGCAWSGQLAFGLKHYDHRYWTKIVDAIYLVNNPLEGFDAEKFLDTVSIYQKHRASRRIATGRFDD